MLLQCCKRSKSFYNINRLGDVSLAYFDLDARQLDGMNAVLNSRLDDDEEPSATSPKDSAARQGYEACQSSLRPATFPASLVPGALVDA